jgi:hypothetical protein
MTGNARSCPFPFEAFGAQPQHLGRFDLTLVQSRRLRAAGKLLRKSPSPEMREQGVRGVLVYCANYR